MCVLLLLLCACSSLLLFVVLDIAAAVFVVLDIAAAVYCCTAAVCVGCWLFVVVLDIAATAVNPRDPARFNYRSIRPS